jgi:hypothetical protein
MIRAGSLDLYAQLRTERNCCQFNVGYISIPITTGKAMHRGMPGLLDHALINCRQIAITGTAAVNRFLLPVAGEIGFQENRRKHRFLS